MKVPMQVYFEPETIMYLKEYARQERKTVAEVVREAVEEKKVHKQKREQKEKAPTSSKHPVFMIMDKARAIKGSVYQFPHLSDDEVLAIHHE